MTEPEAGRPRTVLLDVNGTLTDPAAIGEVWQRPELGPRILEHAIHTAMVEAVLGGSDRPFGDHLRAAIEVVTGEAGLDPAGVAAAVQTAGRLPARPGAGEALAALKRAGLRVWALTNSGAQAGERTLVGCGLAEHVDRVLGVDAIRTFKPDPAVYAYALSELGDNPTQVALLATHPWDLAGAAHAGMLTAWVRHGIRVWPAVFPGPDVQGDSLAEAVAALIGLGAAAD